MTTKCQNYNRNYKIQDMEDMQQKRKHDLGLLEVSYATSCCRKALNEREILFFRIIITGLIQNLEILFVQFV